MKVKSESEVAQSCPTLHDPMDCSLPGSSVHGIFQARVLEWGAIAFSDSLSHSVVFLYFFALIPEEGFLISPCYSLELCIQMGISFLCSFAFLFPSFHSYLWLLKLTKIKNSAPQLNQHTSSTDVYWPAFSCCMWLVATALDSLVREHCCHCSFLAPYCSKWMYTNPCMYTFL